MPPATADKDGPPNNSLNVYATFAARKRHQPLGVTEWREAESDNIMNKHTQQQQPPQPEVAPQIALPAMGNLIVGKTRRLDS